MGGSDPPEKIMEGSEYSTQEFFFRWIHEKNINEKPSVSCVVFYPAGAINMDRFLSRLLWRKRCSRKRRHLLRRIRRLVGEGRRQEEHPLASKRRQLCLRRLVGEGRRQEEHPLASKRR